MKDRLGDDRWERWQKAAMYSTALFQGQSKTVEEAVWLYSESRRMLLERNESPLCFWYANHCSEALEVIFLEALLSYSISTRSRRRFKFFCNDCKGQEVRLIHEVNNDLG